MNAELTATGKAVSGLTVSENVAVANYNDEISVNLASTIGITIVMAPIKLWDSHYDVSSVSGRH